MILTSQPFGSNVTRIFLVCSADAFWVGARFVPAKRKWEWLTGRSVDQGEWRPSQPDRNPGKKCVFLDKWSGYRANNFFCGEKYPFVCEGTGV